MSDPQIIIRPGDFIQYLDNFGDIWFEVASSYPPTRSDMASSWYTTFYTFDKYGSRPHTSWNIGRIRRVMFAEMAVPTIMARRERFKASFGQYDPLYGFAPTGTHLRKKGD